MALGTVIIGALALIGQVRANAVRNWPETTGRVLSAEVEKRVRAGRRPTQWLYYAKLTYEYTAEGQTLRGNNITRGRAMGYRSPEKLQAELQNHPVGSFVTVYYNPANPAEALLSHRTPQNVRVLWLVFAVEAVSLPVIYFFLNNFMPTFMQAVTNP